ncbi:MAG: DMT family transporter [Clostridia bacterium]|nr:DMT family transporter [Clostridia bacterium]MBQ7121459.1 DMT family transporter [Clostridia bacterium]
MKKEKILGPFYCILAAVVWGLSFVAQSEGASIGTFTFNGLRTLLGGIVLVPLVILSFKSENKKLPEGEKKKFPFKDVLIGGVCCGIPLFIGGNLQQHAFNYIDVGKVGFITALYMVLVPVIGIFLKQKARFNIWIGVAFGVIGLYFLSIPKGDFSIGKGELITICCSVAFAAHILVIDHFCKKVNNIALSCAQFFVAGTLSVICMFIFEEPKLSEISGAWLPLVYAGVMSCGVAFTAQIFGQKYAEPAVASLLLCLESVFAVLFGWLLLDQMLSQRELFGCLIMFIAIVFTQVPTEVFLKPFKKKNS